MTLASGCGRVGFDERVQTGPSASFATSLEVSVECGVVEPMPRELQVTNTGDAELLISNATAGGGFVVMTPFPISIPPAGTTTISIRPPAAVIGTDRSGDQHTGTLELATNEDTPPPKVSLSATVVGANLEITDGSGNAAQFMFSESSGVCPAPQTAVIVNSGDLEATLAISDQSGLAVSGFTGGTITGGAGQSILVRPVTAGPCAYSGQVTYVVTGAVCTETPLVLEGAVAITGASTCACS